LKGGVVKMKRQCERDRKHGTGFAVDVAGRQAREWRDLPPVCVAFSSREVAKVAKRRVKRRRE